MVRNWLVFFLVFITIVVKAQYYENGQDPFSIKWKYIKSDHFKVIFPESMIAQGKKYVSYLEHSYESGGKTLSHHPKPIPVIIHNLNALSNGEVAWAPKRMNIYAIAPQSGYSEMYSKHLALHEFRHVVQIDKLNQKTTKGLHFVFGEQALGGILGWHIPLWFFEGDAVAYETGASNTGRGRFPDFSMKIKAQLDYFGAFSYPKAQFGSYKHFVPSHYDLGYQLVTKARIKYNDSIWSNVLNRVAKSPFHPNAFSKGIKESTGLPERKLYEDLTTNDAQNNIKKNDLKVSYSSYYAPNVFNKNIISYKISFDELPQLVTWDGNEEKSLYKSGYLFDKTFSISDSILVWNEYKRTRWENENFVRIVTFDLKTKKKRYVTNKTRAYYSRVSPDKKWILSQEVDEHLNWFITIRNIHSGLIKKSIEFKDKQPVQASWGEDIRTIVYFEISDKGKSLVLHNIETNERKFILKDCYCNLSYPQIANNCIYLKGAYNGVSNILRFSIDTENWEAITNVEYGVDQFCINDDAIYYSKYTATGYKIDTVDLLGVKQHIIDEPQQFETPLSHYLNDKEGVVDFSKMDDLSFDVKNYSRIKNLVNVHSWAPIGVNFQNFEIGPGLSVLSQNALNTSILTGGYQYDWAEKSHEYFVNYSYKGFYPIIKCNLSKAYKQTNVYDSLRNAYHVRYSEIGVQPSIILPIIFDKNNWHQRIYGQIAYEHLKVIPSSKNSVQLTHHEYNNLYYKIDLVNRRKTALKDVQPRWGQEVTLRYLHSPLNPDQMGWVKSAELNMYLPGFIKNHGIKIYGAYQTKKTGQYFFSDQINYPYGYEVRNNDEMFSMHAFYHLPLLYPDLNLFEWIYIKRLKANLFYQISDVKFDNINTRLTATGCDLTANAHVFRFVFPVETGIRFSRMIENGTNYYQFLISFIL